MAKLGKVEQFLGPVRESMQKYEQDPARGGAALSAMLRELRGYQQTNFSDTALDLINKKLAVKESLLYLEFRGATKQQAMTLEQLPVPPEMERLKQRAYGEIAKRAGIWDHAK